MAKSKAAMTQEGALLWRPTATTLYIFIVQQPHRPTFFPGIHFFVRAGVDELLKQVHKKLMLPILPVIE